MKTPPPAWRRFWQEHRSVIITLVAVCIGTALLWGQLDLDDVHSWAEHIDPGTLFVALVLLPLCTFPVTPLNIIAGIRFGLVGGIAIVAGAIVVQHGLAYLTAHFLPQPLKRRMEPLRKRLPSHAQADAAVFASLVPGAPYWVQLYVLPLVGIRFGTYLFISAPLHIVRSITAIIAGRMSEDLSLGWGIALTVYGILLVGVCFLAGRRLKRKYGDGSPSSPSP